MKPMLAVDWEPEKVKFPVMVMPKVDGVRAVNFGGTLTGRSLKKHRNRVVTERFSLSCLDGCDGEMVVEDYLTKDDCCRITSSALSAYDGRSDVKWWLFDYVKPEIQFEPYHKRYERLIKKVITIQKLYPKIGEKLGVIPFYNCSDMNHLLEIEDKFISQGFEGLIVRDPDASYKYGRSTVKNGELLRIKRFIHSEAVIVDYKEGKKNDNEAIVNELGLMSRSTHSEFMVPNQQIGTIICKTLEDIKYNGRVIITKDSEIEVGPGKLNLEERKYYFKNPNEFKGRIFKYKLFPHGIKDKPRFPTFESFRSKEDM